MAYKTLRLILGDQLNAKHSWFKRKDEHVLYLIAELQQETNYVKHHVQKLCAFFSAMQNFAHALNKSGHQVCYLTLDETQEFSSLESLVQHLIKKHSIKKFEYQRPDEYRLLLQLQDIDLNSIEIEECDTEHFILPFEDIDEHFRKDKSTRMESFYRKMRTRFDVLMVNGKPLGEQWNFDSDNRNKLKKDDLAAIPQPLIFDNNIEVIKARLDAHNVDYFGNTKSSIVWPTTRMQSLALLEFFCQQCLPRFGTFQDAMTAKSEHAWSLYHSRLSFSLNSKIIDPMTIINRAIEEFKQRPNDISLSQIEGFVRQIIGWREFVRGIYWVNMPSYADKNALNADRTLPEYFWTGDTKMNCMKQSLQQSLDHAYAHHIQRLMVTGNFCLLTGIAPAEVDAWYLGVYIDAIEWVEMPNTRGMCQFADGGIVASKPYTASGSYINRMSDYCSGCYYNVKERTGQKACPFNSLYWHFMERHRDRFGKNPRIGMVYRNLDKMETDIRDSILEHANNLLDKLDSL